MITGSVIFYLHTDNQIRVLYISGLQIGISLLIPRAGGGGYLFLWIFAGCFIFIKIFYKMLALDSRQPLLMRISLDSRDSRQNFAENLLRFAMYNAEFRTLYYIIRIYDGEPSNPTRIIIDLKSQKRISGMFFYYSEIIKNFSDTP